MHVLTQHVRNEEPCRCVEDQPPPCSYSHVSQRCHRKPRSDRAHSKLTNRNEDSFCFVSLSGRQGWARLLRIAAACWKVSCQLHCFIAGKSEELSGQPVVVRPGEGPQIDQAESQPPRVNLALLLLCNMVGTLRVLCLASLSTSPDVIAK